MDLKTFFLNSPVPSAYIMGICVEVAYSTRSTYIKGTDTEGVSIKGIDTEDIDTEDIYTRGAYTEIISGIGTEGAYI